MTRMYLGRDCCPVFSTRTIANWPLTSKHMCQTRMNTGDSYAIKIRRKSTERSSHSFCLQSPSNSKQIRVQKFFFCDQAIFTRKPCPYQEMGCIALWICFPEDRSRDAWVDSISASAAALRSARRARRARLFPDEDSCATTPELRRASRRCR